MTKTENIHCQGVNYVTSSRDLNIIIILPAHNFVKQHLCWVESNIKLVMTFTRNYIVVVYKNQSPDGTTR